MAAKIDLDTAEGAGSTFTLSLEAPVHASAAPALGPERALQGAAVKVATQNPALARALLDQLRRLGASAHLWSPDGLAPAVAPPDILLVDSPLADALATHAARAARALVLAAPDERAALPGHLAAGYAGWLVKPWRLSALIAQTLGAAGPQTSALDAGSPVPVEALPLRIDPQPSSAAAAPRSVGRFAGVRALLVEDNPVNRLLAETHLKRLGCAVSWVGSGSAGMEAATAEPFDIIFLDMRLPGLDGPEVARRIRAGGGPNAVAPIVAFTANTTDADRAVCLAAGMNDFLVKPAGADSFSTALARWTGRPTAAKVAS
jgi:CheY-like chemotaxis protein